MRRASTASIPRARTPRALLIHPPVWEFALYDLYLKPYGLFRIAATLKQAGYTVDYLNCLDYSPLTDSKGPKRKPDGTGKFHRRPVEPPQALTKAFGGPLPRRFARYGIPPEETERRLGSVPPPDIIFLATGMTYWYLGAVESAALVRTTFPGVPLVAGGVYASLLPEHCRAEVGADYVCGSLDKAALSRILTSEGLPSLDGTGPLEAPATSPELWGDAAVLRLNEGCPYSCDYCSSRNLSPEFRAGNVDRVFEQFESLAAGGIRNFAFYDDALLAAKTTSLHPFLMRVIASPYNVSFYTPNAVHLSLLDEVTASLMIRSGFREIRLGYESSSPKFHQEHGQKYGVEGVGARIRLLKKAGFSAERIGLYILAGLPGQRSEEVRDTIHDAAEAKARLYLAEYSPVPGSPLWEQSVAQSRYPLAEEPLFQNNSLFPMEWAGFTARDLLEIKNRAQELNRALPHALPQRN